MENFFIFLKNEKNFTCKTEKIIVYYTSKNRIGVVRPFLGKVAKKANTKPIPRMLLKGVT